MARTSRVCSQTLHPSRSGRQHLLHHHGGLKRKEVNKLRVTCWLQKSKRQKSTSATLHITRWTVVIFFLIQPGLTRIPSVFTEGQWAAPISWLLMLESIQNQNSVNTTQPLQTGKQNFQDLQWVSASSEISTNFHNFQHENLLPERCRLKLFLSKWEQIRQKYPSDGSWLPYWYPPVDIGPFSTGH